MRRVLALMAFVFQFNTAFGADLPPADAVRKALESDPSVLAARAGVAEREAARRALEAGTYELNLRLSAARRRERETGQDLPEYDLGVERGIRSGTKADLDAALGRQGVVRAELAVGEAMHEAARELLRAWFDWLRAAAQGSEWQQQAGLLEQQLSVVEARVRRGDAPRQERLLAGSALEQARSQALLAQARASGAAAQLRARFPAVELPSSPPAVAVQPVQGGLEAWRTRVLQHDHELAVARAEGRRLQMAAARLDADRVPDPTLGAHIASERDGAERVLGFSVAIPLPGEARSANAAGAFAETRVATQREAVLMRRLEASTAALYALATQSYEAARRAQNAADGLRRNAELSERAYALGEAHLADVISARRIAIEAGLAAALATLDAAEARYRLLLDAHELWSFEAD